MSTPASHPNESTLGARDWYSLAPILPQKGNTMQRQQKDHDIARMNSLTNAVTFLSSIQDKLESETELSDLVLKIAGKFYNWVVDGKPDPVQDAVDYVKEELGADPQEGEPGPQGHETEAEYELALFHKRTQHQRKLYEELAPSELEHAPNGQWFERGARTFGAGTGDPYPISKKQYGFIMGLHKKAGAAPDKNFIAGLSTHGASELIELLNQLSGNGNGNGGNSPWA